MTLFMRKYPVVITFSNQDLKTSKDMVQDHIQCDTNNACFLTVLYVLKVHRSSIVFW